MLTLLNRFRVKVLLIILFFLFGITFCYQALDIPFALSVAHWHLYFRALLVAYTNMINIVYFSSWAAIVLALTLRFTKRADEMSIFTPERLYLWGGSIALAGTIKEFFKYAFGRTWPDTWANNPSLLRDHVFGFHFFHGGIAYSSFPSGHMTIICAAMMALFLSVQQKKSLGLIFCLPVILMAVSLLALDYHFLSDVLAGALLGGSVAICTERTLQRAAAWKQLVWRYVRLMG